MGRGPTPLSTTWGLIKLLSRPRGKLWSSLPRIYNLSHSQLTFINVFAPGRGRRPTGVAAAMVPVAAVAAGVAAAGVCDEIPHGRDKRFYQLATRTDLPD